MLEIFIGLIIFLLLIFGFSLIGHVYCFLFRRSITHTIGEKFFWGFSVSSIIFGVLLLLRTCGALVLHISKQHV